jgi:hypothetical protein
VKSREDRQKVMIRARMRVGATWHDVCILNLSRRGLGIQTADSPARGTYVEICRGRMVIVARIMWARGHRAGLQSQDAIWAQGLINEALAAPPQAGSAPVERRRAPRNVQQRHDQSRVAARSMEFACVALFVAAFAIAAFGAVGQALAAPLSQIRAALGPEAD